MTTDLQKNIDQLGFAVAENIYSEDEITALKNMLANQANRPDATFRKTNDLFAIRQVIKEIPELMPLLFNDCLHRIIRENFGDDYLIAKSIYFDKPANSNWFVAYHQDLTISVAKRINIEGFGPWTVKQNQFAVQPPLNILEKNFTIRIHLDDTNEQNGALRVLPASHLKGIYRPETINLKEEKETTCCVKQGGIMIMKPLLMHASSRTTNAMRRRVIHIEFSNANLPEGLEWSEKSLI
ncbi:phytanoyl-CoA dioxygenase family protein [Taibaiella soli]|uniref:Phytanoyl-CoA dioxygenase n=1 Tax=Taibaiella soli TaxID=1649169 RepID=A0A2W2A6L4_9BACT|nr:phytanoyl-CoA dioxygenase family protein [Taibaiella soli]PZF70911.1 phytanoyl-CoA dioxygenase [Taibaiella soli]